MKNIILTGFMGTGKTTVGNELSRILGIKLIDIDSEIEKAENMKIKDIFKIYGEKRFREIETEMIKKISKRKCIIISTGGGAVLKKENVDTLKENGIIICLFAKPETILKRTMNNNERPLLNVENPYDKIKELLEFRMPYYEKAADIIINTDNKNPLQISEEIINILKEKYGDNFCRPFRKKL
jgi:shikimate kinase